MNTCTFRGRSGLIVGSVGDDLQGFIEIQMIHASGEATHRSMMVDTGFNGWLG